MTRAADLASGKGHQDENFPVASHLVRAELHPTIMTFYRFARAADDVADHPTAAPGVKLEQLAVLKAGLRGEADGSPEGRALRAAQQVRGLTERHALGLLEAFRRDVAQRQYPDWDGLMGYCRYSVAPVGRFVLDLHGELRRLWPMNDALCAALQVINHLQNCGKDYAALRRVYLPLDAMRAEGVTVEALGEAKASPALRGMVGGLAERCGLLLRQSRPFATSIADRRLAMEVGVIHALAESLAARMGRRLRGRPAMAGGGA